MEEIRVVPKAGSLLVFPQNGQLNVRHEGAPHFSDDKDKIIIRSDIVFTRRNKKPEDGMTVNVLKSGHGVASLKPLVEAEEAKKKKRRWITLGLVGVAATVLGVVLSRIWWKKK